MLSPLFVVCDSTRRRSEIRQEIGAYFELIFLELEQLKQSPDRGSSILFDLDLQNGDRLPEIKRALRDRSRRTRALFVTERGCHSAKIQAYALGATEIVHRPLDPVALSRRMKQGLDHALGDDPIKRFPCVKAAIDALDNIFAAALKGDALDVTAVTSTGQFVVEHIEEHGLHAWIETVRKHHSQTYQHCLLVTGVAAAFGQRLGCSQADRHKLAFAAMMHDIGKARIPVAILEKPVALNDSELTVLRKHPELGLDALKSTPLDPDILDVVLHHHEYLDGSGYPHGLSGAEISDIVRIATICDIFGALLERRPYKAPISGELAHNMLVDMGGKLDQDLVRAFSFASNLRLAAAG